VFLLWRWRYSGGGFGHGGSFFLGGIFSHGGSFLFGGRLTTEVVFALEVVLAKGVNFPWRWFWPWRKFCSLDVVTFILASALHDEPGGIFSSR